MGKISTVIEIGSGKVVSIVGEIGQYDEAHILGYSSVEYAGLKNGKFLDKKSLVNGITDALGFAEKRAGKRCRQVHIGVPAEFVYSVCIQASIMLDKSRAVTQEDVDELYSVARSKLSLPKDSVILHRCTVLFTLDGARRTMEPVGRRGSSLGIVITYILCERRFIKSIKDILSEYGYTASTFVAAHYAEAIRFIPQEKRDHGACMIDFGFHSTCVMVVRGDGLLYSEVLPFGGANISGDLEKLFSVSHQVAEELKKRAIFGLCLSERDTYEVCDNSTGRFISFPALRVQEIIESRIIEMTEIILDKIGKSGCALPSYVPYYITGGTAEMRGIREFLQKLISHNTVIVQPQSTCFNTAGYSSALAVLDMGLDAEAVEETGFLDGLKKLFGRY